MAEIASHCWTSTVGSGCFWLDVVVGCSRKHLPSFLLLLLPPLLLFFPSNLILPPIRTLRFAIAGNELSGERRVSSHAWSHLQASSSSSSSPWLYSEVLFAFFLSLCFFSEKKNSFPLFLVTVLFPRKFESQNGLSFFTLHWITFWIWINPVRWVELCLFCDWFFSRQPNRRMEIAVIVKYILWQRVFSKWN